jgi:hypothetical protein
MAECIDCGKSLDYRNSMPNGRCSGCHGKYLAARIDPDAKAKVTADHQSRAPKTSSVYQERIRNTKIDAIVVTTETAPNLNIKSRVGIIMVDADCAFDVAMVKNKDALLSNLKSEAHSIGANAVVGVTFDMIETYSASIGIGKVNTFKLIAYGTAVVIETKEGAL